MKRACLFGLAIVGCLCALADDPPNSGKPKYQYFWVDWQGTGSWPDEAQDASAVAESVSNYDGTGCWLYWPACPYAILIVHDMLDEGPNVYGKTICMGGYIDQDGLCTEVQVVAVNPDAVAAQQRDIQNTYCHEFGHVLGAGHADEEISSGCLHTFEDLYYDQHHIDVHMQWEL